MGRPLKTAKTVAGSEKKGAIGLNTETGEQIDMGAYITGGSALDTTNIIQKGTRRFRCTTADGTETCQLTSVAANELTAGQCQITAKDQQAKTYFVKRISANWIEIGALGTGTQAQVGQRVQWVVATSPALTIDTSTYPIGHVNQPGRFQLVTS